MIAERTSVMPAEIIALGSHRFDYIALDEAEVIYAVDAGGPMVYVIGHGGWGSYEWVVSEHGRVMHSNVGHGIAAVALREGLDVALGG